MIQFNLLPDVKIEYIKAQKVRSVVLTSSIFTSIAALLILFLFVGFNQIQKKHISDLDKDIATETAQLKNKPQIDRILTVQNQLERLTGLHDAKPATDRLFGYLNRLTPNQVSITSFNIDFSQKTVSITGTTDSLQTVNTFIDTLKFTKYTTKDIPSTAAFSAVVLSTFGYNTPTAGSQSGPVQPATYTITFAYDPIIFDITKVVTLVVPDNKITTRSEVDKPTDLFTAAPTTTTGGTQ